MITPIQSANYRKKHPLMARSCITLMLANVLLPAHAETLALEEVVVTAQKRTQTLQEVPASVSVISSRYLEQSVATEFSNIGTLVSGLEISAPRDGFTPAIRIRGIGTNANTGISPSVGIFVDEIPLVDLSAAFVNSSEFHSIEVLKGPQSTLFGKGVSSGAIVINTKQASTESNTADLSANIGSHGLREYRLAGNLAINDNTAIRASLYKSDSDGQIDNISNNISVSASDNIGGKLQFLLSPSDALSIKLSYETHALDTTGSELVVTQYGDGSKSLAALNGITLIEFDPFQRKQQDLLANFRETDTDIGSIKVNWDISEQWAFTSITAYQDFQRQLVSSHGNATIGFDSIIGPQLYQYGTTNAEGQSLSQELRLNYTGNSLSSIVGLFYSDSDNQLFANISRPAVAPTIPIRVAILAGRDINTKETGIFTHNSLSLSDSLEMTIGLRYSNVERDGYAANIVGAGQFLSEQFVAVPIASVPPTQENQSWSAVTGGIHFIYSFNDDVSLYAGLDRGFKAGNFANQTVLGNQATLSQSVDKEIADAIELGVKVLTLSKRLQLNAAIFVQQYDDYQVGIVDPLTATAILSNAGEVESRGIEADFVFRLTQSFTLDGTLSYIDSTFTRYQNAACTRPQYAATHCTGPGGTQDLSGADVNGVSPFSANLNGSWNKKLSGGSTLNVRGEYVYRDARTYASDLDPGTRDGSYTLFNASITWRNPADNIGLTLWGRNLADSDYLTNIVSNSDGIQSAGLRVEVGQERSYGVRASYSF